MCGLRVQVLVIMERIVSSKRVEMLNVCLQFLNEFVVIDCWLQRHCEMISGAFYRDEYFILKFDPSPLFFLSFVFCFHLHQVCSLQRGEEIFILCRWIEKIELLCASRTSLRTSQWKSRRSMWIIFI